MVEHRLIERMIALIEDALERIESDGSVKPGFLDTTVDFIQMYVDRTHHGKEEDILFRDLGKKELSLEHRQVMNELIEEHILGRKATIAIVAADARFRNGDASALDDIVEQLKILVNFYPGHIEKEDKVFFPASRTYFTDEEDQAMLAEFQEFDSRLIHEKYKAVLKELEG